MNSIKQTGTSFSYFISIARKTKPNIIFSLKRYTNYLPYTNTNTLFLTPTYKNKISSLDSHKSSVLNSIPVNILKLLKNDIYQQLRDIFNMSFSTEKFPSFLKIAKVIPVHKKESKVYYKNYSPIFLLSNIEKRLSNFLDISNLIYLLQFDFPPTYSTTHALINLNESKKQSLDEGSFGCGIFVDLQKAFDAVDHKILLQKLEYYGIQGICNNWFKSYLSDRKQFVSINGYNSDLTPVDCGVPQGSVL